MSRSLRWTDLLRRFPITLGLTLFTVAMFVVQRGLASPTDSVSSFVSGLLFGDGVDDWLVMLRMGALRADLVADGEYFRLLTPVFLHGGWLHLLLNMFALLQLGALVEMLWGGRRLLLAYAVCGLAGSLCSAALNDPSPPLAVGASGAILGLAGVLMGTMWFGPPSTAQWLSDLLGRRLLNAVLLTFGIGIALVLFVGPLLDNWAHFGGWLCGMLVAVTLPSPTEPDDPRTATAGAAVALLAMGGAVAWMAISGGASRTTAALDFARLHAEAASRQPESNQGTLVRMLDWFERASALDEGLETFERQVDRYARASSPQVLVAALLQAELPPRVAEPAQIVAAERWWELEPDNPDALNSLAWFLVIPESNVGLRDPDRAEELSRRSLRELTPEQQVQRATYLDTLGEVLYVKGEYAAAYEVQQQAVSLLDEVSEERWSFLGWLAPLPTEEFHERLAKIEEAQADSG